MLKIAKNGLILQQFWLQSNFFCKSPPSDFVPVGDWHGQKILSPPIKYLEKKTWSLITHLKTGSVKWATNKGKGIIHDKMSKDLDDTIDSIVQKAQGVQDSSL